MPNEPTLGEIVRRLEDVGLVEKTGALLRRLEDAGLNATQAKLLDQRSVHYVAVPYPSIDETVHH